MENMMINATVTSILFGGSLLLFAIRLIALYVTAQLERDCVKLHYSLLALVYMFLGVFATEYLYGDNEILDFKNTLSFLSVHDILAFVMLCIPIGLTIADEYKYRHIWKRK